MIVIAYPDQGAGNDPEALGFSQKRIIVIACPDQGYVMIQKLWG